MQDIRPDEPIPVGEGVPTRNLSFNLDGTIDPEQLVGFPQEFIDRVNDPEFIAETKRRIDSQRKRDLAVHLFRQRAAEVRAAAHQEHELRRPKGVSGRQRKRLRRAARKVARDNLKSNQEGSSK